MNKIDESIKQVLVKYPETIKDDRLFWFNYLEEHFLISKVLGAGRNYEGLKIIMTQVAPSANYLIKRKQKIQKDLS